MKIMVAFLGPKKNKRKLYTNQIKDMYKKDNSKNNNRSTYIVNKINKIDRNEIKRKVKNISFELNKKRKNIDYLKIINLKKSKKILGYKNDIILTFVFSFCMFLIIYCNTDVVNVIAKYCSNIRQAEDFSITSDDVLATLSLFNKENYIYAENNISEENEVENTEELSEYAILDEALNKNDVEEVFSKVPLNVQVNSETKTLQKVSVNDIWILNYSSKRDINYEEILSKDINLTKKSDKILLYNTHTSESYTNSENYKFEYSSVMRTQDARYNMLAVAKELNDNLVKKGFNSIQNTTPHDYGAYTGAYMKSRETVKNELEKNGGAGIIIDVHRDAMEDLTFRPVANIDGIQVSQIMFVVGIGNENWEDNLRLALKLQQISNKLYPGLCRQMILRDSTYNQDLNKYSLLIEFGATGNTLDEVKLTTRCVSNLLNIIYKD